MEERNVRVDGRGGHAGHMVVRTYEGVPHAEIGITIFNEPGMSISSLNASAVQLRQHAEHCVAAAVEVEAVEKQRAEEEQAAARLRDVYDDAAGKMLTLLPDPGDEPRDGEPAA